MKPARVDYVALKLRLSAMDILDQKAHLEAIGVPPNAVDDLHAFLMTPPKPRIVRSKEESAVPFSQSAVFKEQCRRLEDKIAQGIIKPSIPKSEQLTAYERDLSHIRFLLGGSSIYDGASPHNSEGFRETTVTLWLHKHYGKGIDKPFALLTGGAGCGKTFGTIAHVLKISAPRFDFLGKIQQTNAAFVGAYDLSQLVLNRRTQTLSELRDKSILILDDIGTEPSAGFKGSDFLAEFEALITHRHKHKKRTIITTNFEPGPFFQLYGERIASRVKELGVVMTNGEEDMRGR